MNTSNNRQWTFGIVSTDIIIENNQIVGPLNLKSVVESIYNLKIDNDDFEIIIVGKNSTNQDVTLNKNLKLVNFDENVKPKWITKKKNIIIQTSKYDNVIILHDYITFAEGWYKGYTEFETDWDVSMCVITNKDGTRWRDWILWWSSETPYRIIHNNTFLNKNRLMYDDYRYVHTDMYINGSVIIGKKQFLSKNLLDENLVWGQGEDCEWSRRCRDTWSYKMNIQSQLKLLKQHDNT